MPKRQRKENGLPLWILFVLFALVIALFLLPGKNEEPAAPQDSGQALIVRMLNVGQADAFLIQRGDKNMLIDAGKNDTADKLVETIRGYGVIHFDIVIATHPHEDHIGGLDEIICAFEIDILLMPDVQPDTKTYRDVVAACESTHLKITIPKAGEHYIFGEAEITVIAPNGDDYANINNYSVAVRLVYVSTSFLFMGDAETLSEKEILGAGFNIKSDVLKVGHHGSSSSTSKDFLSAVNPKIALISCGKDNTYGHPHEKTLNALKNAGAEVYRTDTDGTVTLISDGHTITVQMENAAA